MKPDLNTVGGLLPARGYDGQISRSAESVTDSAVNTGTESLVAGQVIGRDPTQNIAAVNGTAINRVCRLARSTDELLGIVVMDLVTYHADSNGNVSYAQYRVVPFLRMGFINASPVEAVSAGDGVVAIFDAGTGVFTGLGGTGNGLSATRRLLKNAKWETDCAANPTEPGELSILTGNSVNYVTY